MAGSERAKSQDGQLWFKSAVKTIESDWAKRSQIGPGSSWAWPFLTRSQIGPRSQYASEQIHSLLWFMQPTRRRNRVKLHNILLLIITGNADSPGSVWCGVVWWCEGYESKMGKIHDNARKLL